jgi:pimeloyl-ACP methyl ester carboxylesterase
MTGTKAVALDHYCQQRGQAFLRFDLSGHGRSSGHFEGGSIGQWAADALAAITELTRGPQVLVGSSMGGWLMLLAALRLPQRIVGMIGLAAAPDFTEERIRQRLSADQKQELITHGQVLVEACAGAAPYPITSTLLEEGRHHLLLGGPIALTGPIRLIQGRQDPDVPWETALRLQECLTSADVEVTLVKSGGHRLSEPADLLRMTDTLERLLLTLEAP